MKIQEFHFLLEKYDSGEISDKELQRFNHLIEVDPVLKKEFENHQLAVVAIKSHALRAELREIMAEDDKKNEYRNP